MPRLLNINAYHYRRGGSDVAYLDHGALFASVGWESGYFAMHHPLNEPTIWSRYFVDEIELGHHYSLARKLMIAGQVIRSPAHGRAITRLLDDFPAGIAHVHLIQHHIAPDIYGALKRRGVPIVLTAHNLKLLCPAQRMHDGEGVCERCRPNAVHRCALRRCVHGSLALSLLVSAESAAHRIMQAYRSIDRIICPSRFYLEKHAEWGWPREKLVYIPNDFAVPAISEVPAPGDYLCYFGRLSFEKGLATLVRAAARTGIKLVLIGEGPEEVRLRRLAGEHGADVAFHGRLGGEALFAVVRGARACVLASEWYENAPKSVLEAFALGKPVIGADIGGIPELITPGVTGWLFDSGDVDALAGVIATVQGLPDATLVAMGRAAADYAGREFGTALYLRRMRALYAELGVRDGVSTT